MHIGFSDVPHRFVATFLYELPFGKGKPFGASNALRQRDRGRLAGGRQRSSGRSGFPIAITGASTGAALARPDRVAGVDLAAAGEPVGLVRRPDARSRCRAAASSRRRPNRT